MAATLLFQQNKVFNNFRWQFCVCWFSDLIILTKMADFLYVSGHESRWLWDLRISKYHLSSIYETVILFILRKITFLKNAPQPFSHVYLQTQQIKFLVRPDAWVNLSDYMLNNNHNNNHNKSFPFEQSCSSPFYSSYAFCALASSSKAVCTGDLDRPLFLICRSFWRPGWCK